MLTSQEHIHVHPKMWTSQESIWMHIAREVCEVYALITVDSSQNIISKSVSRFVDTLI